jgi:hypothetical protein
MPVAVTVVVLVVVLGRGVGCEDRLQGGYRGQSKPCGGHAPEKRAPAGIRCEILLMFVHGGQRYQGAGRSSRTGQ